MFNHRFLRGLPVQGPPSSAGATLEAPIPKVVRPVDTRLVGNARDAIKLQGYAQASNQARREGLIATVHRGSKALPWQKSAALRTLYIE